MKRPPKSKKPLPSSKEAAAAAQRAHAEAELQEFGAQGEAHPIMSDLYRRAKARLRARQKHQKLKAAAAPPAVDPRRLVHELEVHQVELELQNTELQEARNRSEALLERYTDLYDFAPVGYFTLAANCTIRQVNLTGAQLVGLERTRLVGQLFGVLVPPESRPALHAFLKLVFASQTRQSSDVVLLHPGQPPRAVNLEAKRSPNAQECHLVVTDITERQQGEARVRASEVRYRRLFEAAHDGVLLVDPATRKITDANPFMTTLLGYPQEQLVGKELFEIGLLKDEAASQEMFRKLKRSHEVRYEDLPLKSREGRHQEVEVVANLYRENGHAVIQCNIRDITERKQAEAAVRQSEERYRTLFNSMDQGYCILEMLFDQQRRPHDWRFLEVNPSFEKHNGLADAKGKLVSELAPDLEASWFEIYGKVAKTGVPVRIEKEAKALANRWFDLYAFRVGGPNSRKVAVLFSNITARKNSEQELSEKARLLDLTHDAILVRDMAGHIRYWNHGAEALYGWSRKEALGKISHHLLRTRFPTPAKQIAQELHRTDRWVGELVHTKRDGQRITVLVRKTQERDPQGCPASVLEIITDITERKRAEETQRRVAVLSATNTKLELEIVQRQAVEAALRQSEQHQKKLLAQARLLQEQLRQLSRQVLRAQEDERKRISRELHDVIAQTLTGINVRLANLKSEAAHDTRGLERSIASTQRLVKRSVDIVHDFARELRPAVLDDLGLIPALHSFMKEYAVRTGIHTRLSAFAEVEDLDDTRRTVFYRVAQEALSNVAKHAEASQVTVSIHRLADAARMEIKDNGKSFHVEQVFRAQKGKRLGLLGMRERLEMVGGTFTIESEPGAGTTIVAQIPLGKTSPGKALKPAVGTKLELL